MSKTVILCVDDENFILQSLKNELVSMFDHQYLVETAENGTEAEEIFGELLQGHYTVPVVLCDYIMPGMKGDELLKRLHRLSPQTRKILLTGQATLEGVTNAINEANLFYYIEKPWKKMELKAVIATALEAYGRDQKLSAENKALKAVKKYLETKVDQKSNEFNDSILELEADNRRLALGQLAKCFLSFQELGASFKNIKANLDLLGEQCRAIDARDASTVDHFLKMEQSVHFRNRDEIDKMMITIRDIGKIEQISQPAQP